MCSRNFRELHHSWTGVSQQQNEVVGGEGGKLEVSRGWGVLQKEKVAKNGMMYSKSPTYEPSSCELSKIRTCVPSMSRVSEIAACLLLLSILQLYHLPPPLPPPVSNSSSLFTRWQPLYANCCTVLLYFSRYCTVRLKMFFFVLFVFYALFV